MTWIVWAGVGLVVLLLVVLIMSGRKNGGSSPDRRMTTDRMSEEQRAMWAQAEAALIAFRDARGDEVGPARARLLGAADAVDARVRAIEGEGASERQVLMFRLAAEEIREFVNDALARRQDPQHG